MLCYSTASNLKLRKFFWKNQVFSEKKIHEFWKFVEFQEFVQEISSFVNFSKAFDSTQRGKIEQIFLANGFPKETIVSIVMAL